MYLLPTSRASHHSLKWMCAKPIDLQLVGSLCRLLLWFWWCLVFLLCWHQKFSLAFPRVVDMVTGVGCLFHLLSILEVNLYSLCIFVVVKVGIKFVLHLRLICICGIILWPLCFVGTGHAWPEWWICEVLSGCARRLFRQLTEPNWVIMCFAWASLSTWPTSSFSLSLPHVRFSCSTKKNKKKTKKQKTLFVVRHYLYFQNCSDPKKFDESLYFLINRKVRVEQHSPKCLL